MRHYSEQWIKEWCLENGWTDLSVPGRDSFWAFPPGAVMPEPIPQKVLRSIKAERGFTLEERNWLVLAIVLALFSLLGTYYLQSPLPLVFAFAGDAIIFAGLEVEES